MATYLELTNNAIRESGADLDVLTSGTFSSTTIKLQQKFIAWVAQAYKEIQLSSNSWEWKNKQTNLMIEPRIYVERFNTTLTEAVKGGQIIGSTSLATATITDYTTITGTFAGGTAFAGYLHLKDYSGQLQFNELLDFGVHGELNAIELTHSGVGYTSAPDITFSTGTATATCTIGTDTESSNYGKVTSITITDGGSGYTAAPTVIFTGGGFATTAVAVAGVGQRDFVRFIRWGRYDLQTEVSDLLEADMGSFYIQNSAGYWDNTTNVNVQLTDFDTSGEDLFKLGYLKWEEYLRYVESGAGNYSRPMYITTAPDGTVDFYPKPDKAYVLHFTYTAEPQILSAYSDTPTNLASEYHDAIFWRAVMHYADYDAKPRIYMAAKKRFDFYMNRMGTNLSPQVTWYPSPYRV